MSVPSPAGDVNVGQRVRGSLFALLAASLFGVSIPLSKLVIDRGHDPLAVSGLLYAGATLGAALLKLARRVSGGTPPEHTPFTRRERAWLWLATLVGGVVATSVQMLGLERTSGMVASLLLTAETPATALIAVSLFGERFTLRLALGTLLVVGGAAAMQIGQAAGTATLAGTLLIVAGCVGWAVDNNATTRVSQHDALRLALFKSARAAPVLLALAAILRPRAFASFTPGEIVLTLAVGAMGYGMSLAAFVRALRAIGAARTGVLFATAPFLAALVALPLFRDRPTLALGGAGVLMAAGVFAIVTEAHRP